MARNGGPSVDVRIHSWPGPTVDVGSSIARPTIDPQLAPNRWNAVLMALL